MVHEITNENFEELVTKNEGLAVVDFWATWCGPCKMQMPIVEELSDEFSDITFCKIDVDQQQDLAMLYGVLSIPTVMIFKNGECVSTNVGVHSKDQLCNEIERYI